MREGRRADFGGASPTDHGQLFVFFSWSSRAALSAPLLAGRISKTTRRCFFGGREGAMLHCDRWRVAETKSSTPRFFWSRFRVSITGTYVCGGASCSRCCDGQVRHCRTSFPLLLRISTLLLIKWRVLHQRLRSHTLRLRL